MRHDDLFALLHELRSIETRSAAEDAIDAWARRASPEDIAAVAARARLRFTHALDARWQAGPLDAGTLDGLAPRKPLGVAALLSLHRSGYVRETAVRRMAAVHDEPFVVPFLLLRVDDVVPGLQALAADAIELRLAPAFSTAFARCLGLATLLARRARGGRTGVGRTVIDGITRLLSTPASRQSLVAASAAGDREVRLAALRIRVTTEPAVPVLQAALADADTVVRRWAARTVASAATTDAEKRELLVTLEASPSPWPRLLAVRLRAKLDIDDSGLELALLDRRAVVRGGARAALRARRPDAPLGAAREAALAVLGAAAAPVSAAVGALGALADVGLTEDTIVARRFLADSRRAVRIEAARTVAVLER